MVGNIDINAYVFDTATQRYRNRATGRFVSSAELENVISDRIERGLNSLDAYLVSAVDPSTSYNMSDFQLAFADELRNLHVQMAVLGSGGRQNMTAQSWGTVGATLRSEYGYMRNFVQDIQNGNLTERQIRSRMSMYTEKITNSFWAMRQIQATSAGFTEMRRQLRPAEHCNDCVRLAGLGWQPIGTLPLPADGSTPCRSRCRCTVEYR